MYNSRIIFLLSTHIIGVVTIQSFVSLQNIITRYASIFVPGRIRIDEKDRLQHSTLCRAKHEWPLPLARLPTPTTTPSATVLPETTILRKTTRQSQNAARERVGNNGSQWSRETPLASSSACLNIRAGRSTTETQESAPDDRQSDEIPNGTAASTATVSRHANILESSCQCDQDQVETSFGIALSARSKDRKSWCSAGASQKFRRLPSSECDNRVLRQWNGWE